VRGIRFRSKSEANYAAYLEWLHKVGQIADWQYEPRTFWFTPDAVTKGGVRRGVTSYKPDFEVVSPSLAGLATAYHEVKGYFDARSKTALARMARYYPSEKVVVIDSKHMAALKRQVGGIVPGWMP
jgi:hypothetical protein